MTTRAAPEVRRLAATGARVGESPLWLPERGVWAWLDLQGREAHLFDPRTGEDRVIAGGFAEDLACLARWTPDACLLVSVTGFHRLGLDTGEAEPVPCPIRLPPDTIFNDGKVDRHGALWLGSSDRAEAKPLGRLWRLADAGPMEVERGFVVSNGPAFSPSGEAAYFADTFGRRILRFALDAKGRPSRSEVFAEVPEAMGYPDGMTVAASGDLLVAHWDGARVSRWSPGGALRGEVGLPARNVTSLSFGGGGMRDVLVTTAQLTPGQEGIPRRFDGDLLGWSDDVAGLEDPALAGAEGRA